MSIIRKENKILIVSKSNDPISKLFKEWFLALNTPFLNLVNDSMSFNLFTHDFK
jgi:hypothetical protein